MDEYYGEDIESGKSPVRSKTLGSKLYEIYIDRAIEGNWYEEINILRDAQEEDKVSIYFDSPGGELYKAITIIGAVKDCKAEVTGILTGSADSAASMILLSCDAWVINSFTRMLIHTCSTGSIGKMPDVFADVYFTNTETERLVKSVYKDFLHDDEIEKVLLGKPIVLNDEDIIERLSFRQEIRQEELNKEVVRAGDMEDLLECPLCKSGKFFFIRVSEDDDYVFHCQECLTDLPVVE